MKNLILILGLIVVFASCKKNSPEPQIIEKEKIVTVHDTTPGDTIYTPGPTIHDTIYYPYTAIPLNGIWNCWKMESGSSSTLHSDWVFTFGNTTFTQNLGSSGTYNYPITYYSGSVDIFFTTGNGTTYYITALNNGTEYKLTKTSGTVQTWYLRK